MRIDQAGHQRGAAAVDHGRALPPGVTPLAARHRGDAVARTTTSPMKGCSPVASSTRTLVKTVEPSPATEEPKELGWSDNHSS